MKFDGYKQKQGTYREFAETVRFILDKAIARTPGCPAPQSIQARAKAPDSLKVKLEKRHLIDSEAIESEIKDLAGIRLIFYTTADVDKFNNARIIHENFNIHWEEAHVHQPMDDTPDQKYRAIHYAVSLKPERDCLPEYAKFKNLRCEIQIQTVLDHAWAEINHVLYKKPESTGFGTRAWEAIEKRMNRIMDEYLLPANHDLRKVQYDYERLLEGKRLFDRGTLESLTQSQDNNERYEILSTIKDYVLPNFDDIKGVYPDLCRALMATADKSKETETRPIETSFGRLRGKTSKDITSAIAGIIEELRYVNTEQTFSCLAHLFKTANDDEERKSLKGIVEHFASYNLSVLKEIGYHVQAVLVQKIKDTSLEDRLELHDFLATALKQVLEAEVSGASWSFDKVTLSRGCIGVNDDIQKIRTEAINILFNLLDLASSESEKRTAVSAIDSATRCPSNYTEDVCSLILENTKMIVDGFSARISDIPFFLLERVEHSFWLLHHRAKRIMEAKKEWTKAHQIAGMVSEEIYKFRGAVNENAAFVQFKTLVGFEGVFPEQWENEDFDVDAYRKTRAKQYAHEVNEENKDEWYDFIKACVKTRSNDLATFPVFGEFLHELAQNVPNIAEDYIKRGDDVVLNFLSPLLAGIAHSKSPRYNELVLHLISEARNLLGIAIHFQHLDALPENLLNELATKVIQKEDNHAAIQLLSLAVTKNEKGSRTLIERLFKPMLIFLNQHQDARWIQAVWYIDKLKDLVESLSEEELGLIMESFVIFPAIDPHAEWVLFPIAKKNSSLIWKLFSNRVKKEQEESDAFPNYDALPHEFHRLHSVLREDIDTAIEGVRALYRADDPLFEFNGGTLLHAVFPAIEEPFAEKLINLAKTGEENIGFVLGSLKNYHGDSSIHPIVKAIIERLPEDSPMINTAEICLLSTGVVSGEFGMVEAYRKKRDAMNLWLADENEKVKRFAEQFSHTLTQMMASEQRRSEQHLEARKRDYDNEDDAP